MSISSMTRDIIVIGGSAGGVEAILRLAEDFPPDLPAAVFVVIHTSPNGNGELARLLDRVGPLACSPVVHGEEIQPGRIYLARPDHHLLIQSGRIGVVHGPRENRHRPAIDPLFRSAALAYGSRVIGVILSGTLDDGSIGLSQVKTMGGLAVVQHPDDALFAEMPQNAMEAVEVDYAVPLPEMAALLSRLTREEVEPTTKEPDSTAATARDIARAEAGISENYLVDEKTMRESAIPSSLTCPDCGGALFEYKTTGLPRFRCSIGHAVSSHTLLAAQSGQLEEALAASLRSLLESQRLYNRLMEEFNRRKMHISVAGLKQKAEAVKKHAQVIQALLESTETGSTESG